VLRDNIPLVAGTMRNERFRPAKNLDCYADLSGAMKWDSSKIPLFSYSYPKLSTAEGERLSTLQTNKGELLDMMSEPVAYGIPTYREYYSKLELNARYRIQSRAG